MRILDFMPTSTCVAVPLKRILAESADTGRLTAREDLGEPREVTDLAARGPLRSSQRGPAAGPGFGEEGRLRKRDLEFMVASHRSAVSSGFTPSGSGYLSTFRIIDTSW